MEIDQLQYATWYTTVTAGLLMIVVGISKGVLDLRTVVGRCPSCGRLRRRARPCPCAARR